VQRHDEVANASDNDGALPLANASVTLLVMEPDLEPAAAVRRLDDEWNDAYRRHDRSRLASVLADDFCALTPSGESITKASLLIDPPETASSVVFSEQFVQVFGSTAISRGRLQLELRDRRIDQRFVRIFTCREGIWTAVSVAVTPVP
jgi:ketosteroid isomerase-like protein